MCIFFSYNGRHFLVEYIRLPNNIRAEGNIARQINFQLVTCVIDFIYFNQLIE